MRRYMKFAAKARWKSVVELRADYGDGVANGYFVR